VKSSTLSIRHMRAIVTGARASAVLDAVVKDLRASFKSARGDVRRRARLIELVRTVAIGPYECPGEAPWFFTIKVYKDLAKRSSFFPIVFRRDIYRMTATGARKPVDAQLDIVDHTYATDRFTRPSARGALDAIVRHIRGSFEKGARKRASA
jgi:hypothetical protein